MDMVELLEERIQTMLEELENWKEDSEEYKDKVDQIAKLMDRAIELKKIQTDTNVKVSQMREDRKDRLIKDAISIAGIVIPTLVTIWGTVKSIKFEQTGTITTIVGRGFINKLLPKK